MNRIIAFANHKGGVSKTTSVANVGAILSRKGKKVLLVDLDAQANLTDYFLKDKPEETVFNSFVDETPLPIVSISKNLSIVPSSLEMIGIEIKIEVVIDIEKDHVDIIILVPFIHPIEGIINYIIHIKIGLIVHVIQIQVSFSSS